MTIFHEFCKRMGVRFDTVGLGIDQDSKLMTALAAESGGVAIKR